MSRNAVPKVLDVKGAFEPGSKESSKRCNKGGKKSEKEKVELVRRIWNSSDGTTKL